MSKKIIYWLGAYNPEMEAVAKEVEVLHNYFRHSFIFSMTPYREFEISRRLFKCYRRLNPLRFLIPLIEKQFDISHIFSWGGESYYLNRLKNGHKVLTVAGGLPGMIQIGTLKKAEIIVVECERDKRRLIEHGLGPDKIRLIYPGIAPRSSQDKRRGPPFTVLFASAPLFPDMFVQRGVYLLLELAERLSDVRFLILWRRKQTEVIEGLISKGNYNNVYFVNRIVENMQQLYAEVDAVIAPFTTPEFNKPCPLSILEGLSQRRPVIVTDFVGIKDVIEKEQCGVVSKAEPEGLVEAIGQLKRDYSFYQDNCLPTIKQYFSVEKFTQSYQAVYAELAERLTV
jgi:glycosyltransferase involved in cell wall biosynthesis